MNVSKQEMEFINIGSCISICDKKNTEGKNYPFYGINKDKTFMPTVADTKDLDNTKYKIVEKGTFVFSGMQTGRDVCIRIALYDKEEPILVSPAYTTFVINKDANIFPKYLFINFNRFEMDRYGWFLSDGSIRSNLDWDRFCGIQIPLPSIEIQKELINSYEGLKSLAEENESLIKPLSQLCDVYITDCKQRYSRVTLGDYIIEFDQKNTDNKIKLVKSVSVTKEFKDTNAKVDKNELRGYKLVPPKHIAYVQTTKNEKCFANALNNTKETYVVSQVDRVIRSIDETKLDTGYLHLFLRTKEFDRYAIFNSWGSARETFDWDELCRVQIPLPPIEEQKSIVNIFFCLEEAKRIAAEARMSLKTLCPALIQKAINS